MFINSSCSLFSSIPPPPYFYQFLLPPKFINSSFHPNFSIPPPPYFIDRQFQIIYFRLRSHTREKSKSLSLESFLDAYTHIPSLFFLSSPNFINSSSPLFSSIPPLPYFYQFLLLLIFINSSSHPNLSISPPSSFHQFLNDV